MSGYDFSPLYHASQLSFSPGSTFLATARTDRLIVRSTSNLAIVRTWHLASLSRSASKPDLRRIDSVQWSDDGAYVLAFCRAEGRAWVFGMAQEGEGEEGEVARVESGGVEGLERVEWASGGREVLGWGEHGLKLIVYSLSTGQTSFIQDPKASSNCHTFSPDYRYLAVVERRAGKECIGIYDMADRYRLIRHFSLQTNDAQSIEWSPCGRFIAAVDSYLSYSLYIHSPIGPLLTHFSPLAATFSPTPSNLSGPSASSTAPGIVHEDPGLGIRHMAWAPGGQYLLLMGWDDKVRVLEAEGWRCMAQYGYGPSSRIGKNVAILREPEGWVKDTRGRGIVQFDTLSHTSPLPNAASLPSAPIAISTLLSQPPLSISPSGRHFLCLPLNNPTVIHVYTLLPTPGSLPKIVHKAAISLSRPVRGIQWTGGGKERFGVICKCTPGANGGEAGAGGGAVYIWDEEGWVDVGQDEHEGGSGGGVMEGVGIPNGADFQMSGIQFSPDGSTLALQSRGEFCLMYDTDDEKAVDGVGASYGVNGAERDTTEPETEGLSFVREEEEEE